jgi:hypothetical protein
LLPRVEVVFSDETSVDSPILTFPRKIGGKESEKELPSVRVPRIKLPRRREEGGFPAMIGMSNLDARGYR